MKQHIPILKSVFVPRGLESITKASLQENVYAMPDKIMEKIILAGI